MAQGIYLVIPVANFQDTVPSKVTGKYGWQEPILDGNGDPVLDQNGNPTYQAITPTWEQYANKYIQQFGPAVPVQYQGADYQLVEIELSFLNGEITELLTLQKNKNFPDWRVLNNSEAQQFLAGQLDASAEGN